MKQITLYRKEKPSEFLPKLAEAVEEAQLQWVDVLEALSPLLNENGIRINIVENGYPTTELTTIEFTDDF